MPCRRVGSCRAAYACAGGNVRKDVGFGEKEVSMPTSLIFAMERD